MTNLNAKKSVAVTAVAASESAGYLEEAPASFCEVVGSSPYDYMVGLRGALGIHKPGVQPPPTQGIELEAYVLEDYVSGVPTTEGRSHDVRMTYLLLIGKVVTFGDQICQPVGLLVKVGDSIECHSLNFDDNCNLNAGSEPPPLEIVVDFGDGSPQLGWSPTNPLNVFVHQYQTEGDFTIAVRSEHAECGVGGCPVPLVLKMQIPYIARNLNDHSENFGTLKFHMYDLASNLPISLQCPATSRPGVFFSCWMDLPRGSDLEVVVKMTDDLKSPPDNVDIESTAVNVPGAWTIPRLWMSSNTIQCVWTAKESQT